MIRPWVLASTAFLLFVVWSNSFIAIGYLLGSEGAAPQLDWIGLTVLRFAIPALFGSAYCFGFRRSEAISAIRQYWPRLIACGLLSVPCYNLALYYGQQQGVPPAVASLTTALMPLFVMLLAALFLDEKLTRRRIVGFGVAAAGMAVISLSRRAGRTAAFPLLVAITALSPLSWASYSVLNKAIAGRVSPIVWTYLATTTGELLVLPFFVSRAWTQAQQLQLSGWLALLYLAIPCTIVGFALWNWLLKHMPASSVAFTVFCNPPLTTVSKALLATWFPASFVFVIGPQEWVGGTLALLGMAIALWRRQARSVATRPTWRSTLAARRQPAPQPPVGP